MRFYLLAEAVQREVSRNAESYMVEKGNKLACSNEQCGFVKKVDKTHRGKCDTFMK